MNIFWYPRIIVQYSQYHPTMWMGEQRMGEGNWLAPDLSANKQQRGDSGPGFLCLSLSEAPISVSVSLSLLCCLGHLLGPGMTEGKVLPRPQLSPRQLSHCGNLLEDRSYSYFDSLFLVRPTHCISAPSTRRYFVPRNDASWGFVMAQVTNSLP